MKATIVLAMILLLGSPAFAVWPWRHSKSADVATAPPLADPGTPLPGPPYKIGLGDVLRISVWKEPDFSSTVQVRTDGKISIPLLNELPVVGFTPMELAASLTEKLRKYVDDPRVTVILSQARPPIIYMVGETGHHGPMALTPNMTVLQALITAGLTTFANSRKIYILRVENGVEKKIRVNYKRLVKGKSMNQNILLEPGDMVVVP
jgi:polysaccharide export outer membrane protein